MKTKPTHKKTYLHKSTYLYRKGKSFFDYSDKEKAEIVNKAARESNREQKRFMNTPILHRKGTSLEEDRPMKNPLTLEEAFGYQGLIMAGKLPPSATLPPKQLKKALDDWAETAKELKELTKDDILPDGIEWEHLSLEEKVAQIGWAVTRLAKFVKYKT